MKNEYIEQINDLITKYNYVNIEYNDISEEILEVKDKLIDLESKRITLSDNLNNLRKIEGDLLNEIKNNDPDDYIQINNIISDIISNKMTNNE